MTLPSLDTLLTYSNPHVIVRYQKEYPDNKLTASEAFNELLKFFWLGQTFQQQRVQGLNDTTLDFQCVIHEEMKEIDDMWHTFILFTKDYELFCQQYFGHFIHHQPNIDDTVPDPEQYAKELERYLSFIYDHLGEATVKCWFNEE